VISDTTRMWTPLKRSRSSGKQVDVTHCPSRILPVVFCLMSKCHERDWERLREGESDILEKKIESCNLPSF
jgi:hypothetical protein